MAEALNVFIGWDSREVEAYDVAVGSLIRHASIPVNVVPIKLDELVANGLYTRAIDPLATTEFTYSRFLTPHLAGFTGWAVFFDCDFLWLGDIAPIQQYMDDSKAICCVQHDYQPKETTKMDGKPQTVYPRKNWSSFMLFNCDHPSTQKLTPAVVNSESGAYLHRFQWAADDEIGELPVAFNWLEGWHDKAETGDPRAVHFTRGGPWFPEWQDVDYAAQWKEQHQMNLAQTV